jgi:hypothetical protein
MVRVRSPERRVVDEAGRVRFGVFDTPFEQVNLEAARIRRRGIVWPRWLVALRLKEWQHVWVVSDELYFGLAVVDAKYIQTGFTYAVDRASGEFVERTVQTPGVKATVPRELHDDKGSLRASGFSVDLHSHTAGGRLGFRLLAAGRRRQPRMEAELRLRWDTAKWSPLIAVLPFGGNRALYSLKAIVPVEGFVRVGARAYALGWDTARAILDVHKAHYPYRTWWRWATFWGRDDQGREVGLNLTDNVAVDQERTNECGFWLEGRLHRLGPARIEHDPQDALQPWSVGTRNGAARFTFTPEGERHGRVQAGLVMSRFHQPYGRFEGTVALPTGETVRVPAAWGVAEDHVARW